MRRPFRTAAAYYGRYRPTYPPELIEQLVQATGVNRDECVLDLVSGPGSLAIPLASYAAEAIAVDVEPEMIKELRRTAPPNVTAIEAAAEDVDASWGSFRLVTAGRASHWFDPPLVLKQLAAIAPAVALVADDSRNSEAETLVLKIASELIQEPPIERPKFRSPARLGSRSREFEQRVRDELKPQYHERVNVDAVIGRQRLG